MARLKIGKTDDEKVKAKLVQAIEATPDKEWQRLASLGDTYRKLRAVELKQDEGDWGEGLDPVMPVEIPTKQVQHS